MLNSFVANVPTTQRQTSNRIIHFIVEHYEYFNKHDLKEEKKKTTQLKSNVHNMHFTCSIHCGAAASLHNSVKPVFLIQLVFSKYTIMCSTYIFQCKANKMCKSTRARPAHPAHISSKQLLQRYFAKMIVH